MRKTLFFDSNRYWQERYLKGGNSGPGSYGHLAEFKADVINSFIKNNGISSIIEFGCGDGNQLRLLVISCYLGFDSSLEVVKICQRKFLGDPTKTFRHTSDYRTDKAELSLSLDVIYHLVEDDIFEKYMNRLFGAAERKVIIYSSNFLVKNESVHVKHRKFTDWIDVNILDFELEEVIVNKFPFNGDTNTSSHSDFYIYSKK